jgi:RES domain-containing protein
VRLWRVSRHRELNGVGGLLVSGRWHSQGKPVIYAAEHQGTAQLEWLAHLEVSVPADLPRTIPFSEISIPDDASREEMRREDLPVGWEADQTITQRIGDEWLHSRRTLLLLLPSVLVPARNVLINSLHRESSNVVLTRAFDFVLDPRLL